MPITIRVNGKTRSLTETTNLTALLDQLKLQPRKVIVERNRQIVDRDVIDQVILADGDDIEIIRIVSGG